MKVTSVELKPKGWNTGVILDFKDPRRVNPYNIKAIYGLDAEDLVSSYSGNYAGQNQFETHSASRTLVFRIVLNPTNNSSISELRNHLYKTISANRTGEIQILFKNRDEVSAELVGFITKFEASHFTKTPEVQITIECLDSVLKSIEYVDVDVDGMSASEFYITDDKSTAPHGGLFEFEVKSGITPYDYEFVLTDDESWMFKIDLRVAWPEENLFESGDIIKIYSERRAKNVLIVRAQQEYHIGHAVVNQSVWPIIFPGVNKFKVEQSGLVDLLSVKYKYHYWGV